MLDFLSAGKLRKHESVGGKNWHWRAVVEGPNNALLGQQCLMTPKERVKEYLLCGQKPTSLSCKMYVALLNTLISEFSDFLAAIKHCSTHLYQV